MRMETVGDIQKPKDIITWRKSPLYVSLDEFLFFKCQHGIFSELYPANELIN